jgi:hypothetical protein
MPNWCSNSLTLTAATKEEAQELHAHLSTQEADDWTFFGFFVPETWNEEDWYYSRVNAWGTKWDANLAGYDWVDDYNLVMSFDTAWSPPIAVYEAAAEQGWGVVATYYEPGMCFVGSWVDGVDEHYEFQECTSKDVRDVVGDDLDDEWGISESMAEWESEEYDFQETAADSEGKSEAETQETKNDYNPEDEHQGGVEYWGAKR